MLFLEAKARLVLVLHTVAAGVLVGAATHHALACRRYLAGQFERRRVERLYAAVTAAAFLVTFVLGALLYPVYKVRARAEYFDSPQAVASERALRADEAARAGDPPQHEALGDLAWVGRLFDVKEHWVALGLGAAMVALFLSRRAHPSDEPRITLLYFGIVLFVCAASWIGAILGVITASYRSVGGAS